MAEALALASSVAGLLSVTIQIVEIGSIFIADYNNAPKLAKAYIGEVDFLMQTLKNLNARLDDQDIRTLLLQHIRTEQGRPVPAFTTAAACLKECTEELQAVLGSLVPYKATEVPSWDRLKWHFKKSDIRADIERLQRYRMMILDDFENALSLWAAQGLKSVLESQSTVGESIKRIELESSALRSSSQEIDMKLQCFRQDIASLQRMTTSVADALDRLDLKHQDTHNVVQRMEEQQDLLKSIGLTSTKHTKDIIRASEVSTQLEILEWLSDVDPSSNHDIARRMHEPKTGSWLIEHADYLIWRDTVGKILWLHGIAGSGKTVLCSTVIENLSTYLKASQVDCNLAYFYFDFRTPQKMTCNGMLRSLLRQLLSLKDVFPESIRQLFEQGKRKGYQPQRVQLLEALCQVITTSGRTYLVVDALDECPVREDLLSLITELFERSKGACNIFITSRKEFEIEEALSEVRVEDCPQIDIELQNIKSDIDIFIRSRLSADRKLRKWTDQKETLLDVLGSKAGVMFRWVVCQLEALGRCRTLPELEKCLSSLPKTLDATYERILGEICNEDKSRAINALQWLAFNLESDSELPLEVLAEASVTSFHRPFNGRERLSDPREILAVLSALVSTCTDNETGTTMIFLAHSSVKEYLVSARIRQSPFTDFAISEHPSDVNIAGACLRYLLQFDQDLAAVGETSQKYPLLRYAACNWRYHARNVFSRIEVEHLHEACIYEGNHIEELILDLLNTQAQAYSNWLKTLWQDPGMRFQLLFIMVSDSVLPPPTLFAAVFDLPKVLEKLIKRGEPFDCGEGGSATPLQVAAHRGLEDAARVLLENGAEVDGISSCWPYTPLQLAISEGFDNAANLLLDFGSQVDDGVFQNLTPMASVETVDRLLTQAVFKNRMSTLESALAAAASRDLADIGRSLLLNQVDVNCGKPNTPLIIAARTNARRFVLLLLQYGADLDVIGGDGTALMVAASSGYYQLAELLLDCGVNMDVAHPEDGTALIYAASSGQYDIVRLLIDRGAKPTAQRADYNNAVLMALLNDHDSMIHILWNHPNAIPSAREQVQDAIWAAVAHYCRHGQPVYIEALHQLIVLGKLHGILEDPPVLPEEMDASQPLMLQAWTMWTLVYIGPDGCEPAVCLAVETDNDEALAMMNDFGADIGDQAG